MMMRTRDAGILGAVLAAVALPVAARAALQQGAAIPPAPAVPASPSAGGWSSIHNAMVAPITRFPIRGALWYQGESNGGDGASYGVKLRALALGWRKLWAAAEEDKEGKLQRFAIAGADKAWQWADAAIDGETVVVSSPKVAVPAAVRYAFAGNPQGADLYNRDGLPAAPFRTDNW